MYTNADSIAIGVVLRLPELGRSGKRPEEFIADLKAHPSIAPMIDGADLKEYSAHLIPEGGYDAMPSMVSDGLLVAGDAAALCLAAGIWLEGVNFAIGSGKAAAETAIEGLDRHDTSAAGLSGYRTRLESDFVLRDHKKLRRAPHFVLSERVQQHYPKLMCDAVDELFTVHNPTPKAGAVRTLRAAFKRSDITVRDVLRDAWTAARTFG
ncbi:MAG: hypothetical protein NVSMB4_13650 [Acidimicrobiales bacterium]